MKFFNKEIFYKIKNFIIKHHIVIALIGAPILGILGFTGMVVYNQSPSFCLKCHYVKGTYFAIDMRIPPHQNIGKGGPGCMVCHPDKAVERWALRGLKKANILSQRVANLRFTEPPQPKSEYTTEECLNCHPDRLDVMEREPYLLASDKLREIGLKLNKRLHYRFETLHIEDQKLYQELKSENILSKDEEQEIELLEKIKLGNCGQCHLRVKTEPDGKTVVDKQVNFVARNPITCAGCHEDVKPLTHPGKPLSFPSKEICQKCHHGQIHGKFLIFKADCEDTLDTENCNKCHPYYKKEEKVYEFTVRK